MTVAQLIVSDVVPLRERGKYQGIIVSSPNIYKLTAADDSILGRGGCHCKWHWPSHWRRFVLEIGRFVAMDLPHEHAPDRTHHIERGLLHATEEGGRRLESVGPISMTDTCPMLNAYYRKLKAVDFIGIFLALAGTIVLMLGLTWGGGQYPWESAHVIATLVAGFAVCVVFMLWQWKGPRYPLVPSKSSLRFTLARATCFLKSSSSHLQV